MSCSNFVSLCEIQAARERIGGIIRSTPVEKSASLSARAGVPVMLKFEHHQYSGSFKFRGAVNAVMCMSAAQREAGVVAVSTGNHGRGLAHACAMSGVRCVIAMSELVPQNKIVGIKSEGAEVLIHGKSQDEAQLEVDRLVAEGMTQIPPFDHPDIIAGQGTIGLEIIEAMADVATVIIPLSGGGLASGVAAAVKGKSRGTRIVAVSMERGAAMYASQQAGQPIEVTELPTLADSLGGGIGLSNRHTFAMVRELVDEIVLLDEPEIARAISHSYWEEGQVVEGSGAVGVGAVLAEKVDLSGPTMILLSGRNLDMELHHRIISGEMLDINNEAL